MFWTLLLWFAWALYAAAVLVPALLVLCGVREARPWLPVSFVLGGTLVFLFAVMGLTAGTEWIVRLAAG